MRRLNRTKRRMCIGAFTLVTAPLLLASVASACTQLKNLNANPGSGAAGATIQVTGTNYVKSGGPVEIRLNTRTGEPLASLPAASITDIGGTISLSVTIPANAAVGYHTLIATQRSTANGALLNGFPVRATYRVTAAAATRESNGSVVEPVPATAASQEPAAPAAQQVGATGATTSAATGAVPVGADAATANPVTPVAANAPTAAATSSASASASAAIGSPAAPASGGPAAGSPAAAPVLETSTPALAAGASPSPAVVTAGLVTAVAERSTSTLPQVMLAIGAAMVLLSLGASLTSGRSVFTGRRPNTLA